MQDIAVIGAGHWGERHIRLLAEQERLAAICDSDTAVSASYTLPHVRTTTHVDAIFADPAVRAVVIATPASSHAELTARALHAGKDVLVEKPVCFSTEEAAHLTNVAETQQCILMAGHLLHYHPAIITLKQLITDGILGDILHIDSIRTKESPSSAAHAGALWELAPHDVSLMLSLFFIIDNVTCVPEPQLSTDAYVITCVSEQRTATVTVGYGTAQRQQFTVEGTKGSVVFEAGSKTPLLLTLTGQESVAIPVASTLPLTAEHAHFAECLDTRQPPLTGPDDILRTTAVLASASRCLS